MKKTIFNFSIALIFTALSLWGCSGNSGEESEKGAIRKMTDQVANDLVHKMRDPIDKARSVKDRENERLSDMAVASEDAFQTE
jgi:hypothetical protein